MSDKNDLLARCDTILERARLEKNRPLTPGERSDFDAMMAEVSAIDAKISKPVSWSAGSLGLSDREKGSYSLRKAILSLAEGRPEIAPLEHEVSAAEAKRLNKSPRGLLIPSDVTETRTTGGSTMLVGTTGIGGYLVESELGGLVDIVRNRMVIRAAGARILSNLQGDVLLPKTTADPSAVWTSEDSDTTISAAGFSQITLSPKTVGSAVVLSRKLLLQNSISVDDWIKVAIGRTLAVEIDRSCIAGTGAPELSGMLTYTGCNANPMSSATAANATPTWTTLVAAETAIAQDSLDVGQMSWIISPRIRGYLRTTTRNTGSGVDNFMMSDNGTINGYRCFVTPQMPDDLNVKSSGASGLIFGNFEFATLAFWSGVDLVVDVMSKSLSGAVVVVAHQDLDFCLTFPDAFAVTTDADIS